MELHQIRYFIAVAETLNFTRAAEQCNVAQPSLSRAIGKLEAELGGELFRRERNRTHLTELGREMLPILRQAFENTATAKELAASFRTARRAPLRIGLSLTVHLDVVAPILVELSRNLPALHLHLMRGAAPDVLQALELGEIELAVAGGVDAIWDRFDRWPMFEEGFVLLAQPGWAPSPATPEAIEQAIVIARPYCETLTLRQGDAITGESRPMPRHEVSCEEDAARLVRCGMGIAIVPESSRSLLPESACRVEGFEQVRTVFAYGVAGRRRSVAGDALLKLLRAADWPAIVQV